MAKKEQTTQDVFFSILPGFTKAIAIFGVLATVIFGIMPVIYGTTKQLDDYVANPGLVRDYNPKKGKLDSKVTVVEFLDFQCPGCKGMQPVMNQISEEYKNEVRFVIKMYPLPQHANAQISAESAMAALNQNKFFEFGDKLFAYQDTPGLSSRTQEQVATELNLDMTQWNKDRKTDQITKQIKWDQEDGRRAVLPISEGATQTGPVDSTPTFVFMKDDKILYKSSGMSVDEFRAKLDKLLGKDPKTADPATADPNALSTPSVAPVTPATIETK